MGTDCPACFQHPLLTTPWGERHLRALRYLAQQDYATVQGIGQASGAGVRRDGRPLTWRGGASIGGILVNDLMRLGFATIDADGYYKATREGLAVIEKGPLRYAVERLQASTARSAGPVNR